MRLLFLFIALHTQLLYAQLDSVIFIPRGQYNYPALHSAYKTCIDRQGRPYVYAASKEQGLVTFDISNINAPAVAHTFQVADFNALKPTYVEQHQNLLYVSTGDFQTPQNPGFAVIDVSTPAAPVILDQWSAPQYSSGVSSFTVQNGYAFLACMEKGLIILDVTNPQNIQYVSTFLPDTAFGNPPYAPNARGVDYRNDTLLLAFDAGGLRVIDVTSKQNPVEIGKYINTSLTAVATAAYNEVKWIGSNAWVPVDYCGLEVIDVSNPSSMTGVAWLNTWNCVGASWFGSDGHGNQIMYIPSDQIVMMSAGDTEILAVDASVPSQPRIMGMWGPPNDLAGSWGFDNYNNTVALARGDNPLTWPFDVDTGGIKLLNWIHIVSSVQEFSKDDIHIYPNPAQDIVTIEHSSMQGDYCITVYNASGQIIMRKNVFGTEEKTTIDLSSYPSGLYLFELTDKDMKRIKGQRVMKE